MAAMWGGRAGGLGGDAVPDGFEPPPGLRM